MPATKYTRSFEGVPDLGALMELIDADATIEPKHVDNGSGGMSWAVVAMKRGQGGGGYA